MKRILVIEDDPAVRGLITETLRFRGWEPVPACNGEEGVAMASSESPDLILCDIQMPKLDGYGVLRNVRANPGTATVPFVFLTGLTDKPRVRQAMEAGADDYIVKPFTIQELIAAVDARFQKQAVLQETAERKLTELRESLTFALPHELVTPLNTILGFSSLLLDSPHLQRDEMQEYATHIRDSGMRLRKLIEKFLLYAQVELTAADAQQRKLVADRAASAWSETISVASIRAAREGQREADLQQQIEEAEHRISPAHLERIVRELIENACKFSTAGTPVEIHARRSEGALEIAVTDRGRGFTPDQIQRIGANLQFNRQLQEQQGTGLGLAIVRRLAGFYEGTITVQSTPGERTEVKVHLPC